MELGDVDFRDERRGLEAAARTHALVL